MKLELQYLKRISSITFFMQICLFLGLATIQSHHILMTIQGMNLGTMNFLIMVLLSLLEWSNFIIFFSLLFSILWILYDEFILIDLNIMFIQMSLTSWNLFKCIFINNFIFGVILLIHNLFFAPYCNGLLINKIVEAVKNKIIYMIEPKKILTIDLSSEIKDINISVSKRDENILYGLLLNHEYYDFTVFIHKFAFEKNDYMEINLDKMFVFIKNNALKMKVSCQKCNIKINPDIIIIKKKKNIFSEFSWAKFFIIFKLFFIIILLSFWIFDFAFYKNIFLSIFNTILFLFNTFNALSLIKFHFIFFILFSIIIIFNFYKGIECLNF